MRLGEFALTSYEAMGRPPVCPCCGAWGGPPLPMCTDPGWEHYESCGRIRWAKDICQNCAKELA